MAKLVALLGILAVVAGLAGCAATVAAPSAGGPVRVVAAENFWGDLVRQVGGARVRVTSLLTSPDADPHLFQPGTVAGLAVARANVVVVNGAGYDPFMQRLIAAAPSRDRAVVRVADVLGATAADANPHLWYDVPRLPAVAVAIGRALTVADPAHAAAYRAGVRRTVAALRPVRRAVAALRRVGAGQPVAYTERVPGYLLAAAGLRVLTPPGFSHAVETGIEPSFADIATMRDLLTSHQVRALVDNTQATDAVATQLVGLARDSGVPVVPVTETMPTGTDLESWQLSQIRALRAALAS